MGVGSWRLVVCGISHQNSTLEQREPLTLGQDEIAGANAGFGNYREVLESLILSTCNRTEFYFVTDGQQEPMDLVKRFYREHKGIDISDIEALFQKRKAVHAAAHLFRVSAGIDAMVLGENQILGQVKDAYSSACAVKTVGKVIHRLFHQAFRVGKLVRSDTEMGRGACSVSTAAVEMLTDKIGIPDNPSALLVGVNQMINLAATKLRQLDGCHLTFANRSREKAKALANKFDGEAHGLGELTQLIARADLVITCTASPQPIITEAMLSEQAEGRPDGKCVIVDLAIPRDVDCPQASSNTYDVYNLEDVKTYVKDQQSKRMSAIPQAEKIIDRRLAEFSYWYEHVQNEPIYNGANRSAESIREEELAPLLMKVPAEMRKELERVSRRLVDRIISLARKSAP